MTYQYDYRWHPKCNTSVFTKAIEILHKLNKQLIKRTLLAPKEDSEKLYEVIIFNMFHPLKHCDSYYWVQTDDLLEWYPTNDEIDVLREQGWMIQFKLQSAL